MSTSGRKTRRPSAAAAADAEQDHSNNHHHEEDGNSSVASSTAGSKASRSSARLKRKRLDAAAAAAAMTQQQQQPSIPQDYDDDDVPRRTTKRQRRTSHNSNHHARLPPSSARKQRPTTPRVPKHHHDPAAASSDDDDDERDSNNHNHQQFSIPTEIETKPDNGHNHKQQQQQQQEQELQQPVNMEEEEDDDDDNKDGKPSAVSGENGHALSSSLAAAPPAMAAHTETVMGGVEMKIPPTAATTAAVVASIPPAAAAALPAHHRREPRISSQQPTQQQPQPVQQKQPPPMFSASIPHEPEENGLVAAPPPPRRPWERLVAMADPVGAVVYETTTATVVATCHAIRQLVLVVGGGRLIGDNSDEGGEIVEEAVGVPVPEVELLHQQPSSPWDRSASWIILLLFLQVLCWPLGVNPILDRTAAFSDILLQLYSRGRRGMESSPPGAADDHMVDTEGRIRQREQLSRLQQRQSELESLLDIRNAAEAMIDSMVKELQEALTEKQTLFSEANMDIAAQVKDLEVLIGMDTDAMLQSPQFLSVAAHWNQFGDNSSTPLIDTSRLELWKIVDMDSEDDSVCASNLVEDQQADLPRLNHEQFEQFLLFLYVKAKEAAASVQEKPIMISSVRQWVRATLHNETGLVLNDSDGSALTYGEDSGLGRLHRLLEFRFEEEMADQTGKWDFASIGNGAQVIKSKTSPSLVDSLPIINRIGSLLGLRFYGHGPEAALTPTHPPYALGQCWSFLDQKKKGTPDSRMLFGVLTVRLAQPIVIESVLLEHPPEDVAQDGIHSAIRAFHVQGYEEADASGEAWELGSFEFKIGPGAMSRQEFEVSHEVDGEDVPVLRAVSIQIESNWGGEYACLYRFRVHGYEEEDES